MANSAGMIKESIWRDPHFRALSRDAQATYVQLVSQKELDRAGIQPLQVSKWAKGCDAVTADDISRDLKELEFARFVFVDDDTDELLIRSYMRHSGVVKQPNVLKSALRCAGLVASETLRHELAIELRSLRRKDAETVADEIDPSGPTEPIENPFGRVAEPIENPSRTPNPSGTLREPPGMGTGTGEVTFRSGSVGGSRARAADVETDPIGLSDGPPPPRCSKHLNDPTDVPCRACGVAREARADWDRANLRRQAEVRSTEARASAELRVQAVNACDLCDENGYRPGASTPCSHDPDEDARRARGRALVEAALAKKGGES